MAKNMAELAAMLEKKFRSALEKEVKKEVTETMQEHIQTDVYDAYTPYPEDFKYERTYQLLEDIEGEMISDNTLKVENTRSENGRDIVEVIETGKGYEWGYKRNLDEEIGARPFVENTKEELRSTGRHAESFKRGLKRQGIDAK